MGSRAQPVGCRITTAHEYTAVHAMADQGMAPTRRPEADDEDETPALTEVADDDADDVDAGAPTRPPQPMTSARIAAATRCGMQTAGLAWLLQADGAGAIQSAGNAAADGQGRPPPMREVPGRAEADVPLLGEPPRYEREVVLPVPDDFVWPVFGFCAFHEHTGEERESHADALNTASCSIADRRTITPPSTRCWHFIGDVRDFVRAYPHPIRMQSNHVTCGWANWACWATWPAKIADGSMLAAAEEFLWINCIGDRSWGEQPPSAHQHTVGPPTFTMYGHEHGAPSKTYCIWARHLPPVPPTDVVPVAQRWNELHVSGTPEQKTVKRSYTPRNVARAKAAAHAQLVGGDTSDFGRPASQPCAEYTSYRQQLHHYFGLLAAHYAPTVTVAWLKSTLRCAAILLVPVAQHDGGPCVMVSLRRGCLFGGTRDASLTGEAQGEAYARFVSGSAPTQYAAQCDYFGHRDAVVMVPWAKPPVHVVQSAAQRNEAKQAGLSAVWCTLGALHDHEAYVPAGLVFQRLAALTEVGMHGEQTSGIWARAKPLVRYRTASACSTTGS